MHVARYLKCDGRDFIIFQANVVGDRCDACAPGHYGLSAELPSGCRPCYCSHITDSCSLAADHDPRDVSFNFYQEHDNQLGGLYFVIQLVAAISSASFSIYTASSLPLYL